MKRIEIYDTTLRDGSQAEDANFSVEDKLRIAEKIDELGVDYIEGGWPGANPRDTEFFEKATKLKFKKAKLVAFGSTHHASHKVNEDPSIKALLAAKTRVVTIFGKTWDFHVRKALKVSLNRNLEIIRDSVKYLKKKGKKVFFDAEHFFDGYKANPEYSFKCLNAAYEAGADCLILCDTNGGTMPDKIGIIAEVIVRAYNIPIGIHAHNDSECAVANSIIAAENGAMQVQGTINGLGERCGNANLISVIPNLKLKLKYDCLTDEQLKMLKEVSRFVTEIANMRPFRRQPYVGDSAFAHKGGIHVSAVMKHPETYEHIIPELVGNSRKILVSDLAGKATLLRKAEEFGITLANDSSRLGDIVNLVKVRENEGYEYEAADASLEILIRKTLNLHNKDFFSIVEFRVISEKRKEGETPISEATIKLRVGDNIEHTVAESESGPVNAIDLALRKALEEYYPELKEMRLADFKVRVLAAGLGTTSKVRVWMESANDGQKWGTVGVSENIFEASIQGLVDSFVYYLLKRKNS